MSNAFTNFLGGSVDSFLGDTGQPQLKDFQHADRLYVRDTYARAPKHGFLYFVSFNINPAIFARDPAWSKNGPRTIGLLVKKMDLPKFQLHTETLNQYNRKTVVQTNIKYNPVSCDFHDDNSDLTTGLWKNYYQYYYGDGSNGTVAGKASSPGSGLLSSVTGYLGGFFKGIQGPDATTVVPASYKDTKYRPPTTNFNYGLNNGQAEPFFSSIDVYVLHQHRFTQYTLVNPLITEWTHDTLDQDGGNKVLSSKMQLSYESVLYNYGKISKGKSSGAFIAGYYDTSPSPLSIGGNGSKGLFGEGGIIGGAGDVLGDLESGNFIGAFLKGRTLVKNAQQLTSASINRELTGLVTGVLGNVSANANQGINAIGSSVQQGIVGGLGFTNAANLTQTIQSKLTGK